MSDTASFFSRLDRRIYAAVSALAGAGVAALLWLTGALDLWEAKTWDIRARLLADKGSATDRIGLILVDQNSLDWGREENGLSWPWPREIYGHLIRYCMEGGAKAVALDVLFTEPSAYGPGDDAQLGSAIKASGRVALALFLGEKTGNRKQWPEAIPRTGIAVDGLDDWLAGRGTAGIDYPLATFPVDEIAVPATMLANVQLAPDGDGVYRRLKLFGIFDGTVSPILGLGTLAAGNPGLAVGISPNAMTVGDRRVPIDAEGNAILRYRGPSGTHAAYSAAAVLQSAIRMMQDETPTVDPSVFDGRYVLIGFSAPGLYDLRPAPVSGVYPGVEIHATALDNLLSGDFIRPAPGALPFLMIVLLSVAVAASVTFLERTLKIILACTLLAAIPVVVAFAGYVQGFAVPLMAPELAVILTIFLSLALQYATEGRQKRYIKNAFSQYLSPIVIEQLIANPDRLKLGGERRRLSIFFSDLESFTRISESLDPEALTQLLNDYLTAMTGIIIEEGGTVDKYEGDAIIAFWNAPLDVPDHAARSVQAALRCQARLAQLRPRLCEQYGHDLKMRIGINTGDAVVGNFGSETKFDYTMLGDSVNLAARLEGTNKQFGTYTMVSEFTRNGLDDLFSFRGLGRVSVVGKAKPVSVFEPMYRKEYEARQGIFKAFEEAASFFYDGEFKSAGERFAEIARFDTPAQAYLKRCEYLIANPPEKWAGVWTVDQK